MTESSNTSAPALPEVSELQAVRHYTNLSRKNFSIDNQFYPTTGESSTEPRMHEGHTRQGCCAAKEPPSCHG